MGWVLDGVMIEPQSRHLTGGSFSLAHGYQGRVRRPPPPGSDFFTEFRVEANEERFWEAVQSVHDGDVDELALAFTAPIQIMPFRALPDPLTVAQALASLVSAASHELVDSDGESDSSDEEEEEEEEEESESESEDVPPSLRDTLAYLPRLSNLHIFRVSTPLIMLLTHWKRTDPAVYQALGIGLRAYKDVFLLRGLMLTDMCKIVRCSECKSWLQKGAALQCLRVRPRSEDDDYEGRLCDRCWAGD